MRDASEKIDNVKNQKTDCFSYTDMTSQRAIAAETISSHIFIMPHNSQQEN